MVWRSFLFVQTTTLILHPTLSVIIIHIYIYRPYASIENRGERGRGRDTHRSETKRCVEDPRTPGRRRGRERGSAAVASAGPIIFLTASAQPLPPPLASPDSVHVPIPPSPVRALLRAHPDTNTNTRACHSGQQTDLLFFFLLLLFCALSPSCPPPLFVLCPLLLPSPVLLRRRERKR